MIVCLQGLAGVINQKDVELIVRAQKKMLQRFEKTNEMLTNVNSLSATRDKNLYIFFYLVFVIFGKFLLVFILR